MRRIPQAAARTAWLACLLLPFHPAGAQTSAPSAGLATTTDPLLLQPGTTPEELEARRELARRHLAKLGPTTQPTTGPADDASVKLLEAHVALFQEWQAYLGQLQRIADLQQALATLSTEQHTEQLSRRIKDLRAKAELLTNKPKPLTASEAEVADATVRYNEENARLNALSELQTRRSTLLATGFKDQREALEVELKRLRDDREGVPPALATTTAPAGREQLDLERRRLDVQVARVELALEALALDKKQTELAHTQDGGLLEALGQYVTALQTWADLLKEISVTTVPGGGDAPPPGPPEPGQPALLDLEHFCRSVQADYFSSQQLLTALKGCFPKSELDRLRDRVTTSAAIWEETTDSVAYRRGKDVMQLHRRGRRERRDCEAELAGLSTKLSMAVSQLYDFQSARDRTLARFAELAAVLSTAAESAEAETRTRLETEATALRSNLDEAMDATVAEAQALVSRLSEAVQLVHEHSARLKGVEGGLYQTALKRRESGLAGRDWRPIWVDLRQLLGRPGEAPATTGADEPAAALERILQAEPGLYAGRGDRLPAPGDGFGGLGTREWSIVVMLVVVGGVVAWPVRRYALRRARWDSVTPACGLRFAERVNRLAWRLAGDVAGMLLPAAALWIALRAVHLPERTLGVVTTWLGWILGAYVLLRMTGPLFDAKDSGRRVVPCNDAVARHYRVFCRWLLAWALIVLLLLSVLSVLDLAPGVRVLLWELLKTGVLLWAVGFLAPKRLVIGLGGLPKNHWGHALLGALYPFLFLGVVGVLVLEVIGYGLLAGFIGIRLAATLLVVAGVGLVTEYICDLLAKDLRTVPAGSGDRAADSDPGPEMDPGAPGRLTDSLLRLVGVALGMALLFQIWFGGAYWSRLGLRPTALLGVIVVAALVIDRLVRTALRVLRVSGRLPQNTANIIRRWTRGVLAVAVALLVIALAGYPIETIWVPLSALLAMVAIGFVAVWSMLSNILATLIILIWRPFNVGERIEIEPDGIGGEVIDINFMYTLLKSEAGARIAVPNSLFVQRCLKREMIKAAPPRSLAEQLEAETPADQ